MAKKRPPNYSPNFLALHICAALYGWDNALPSILRR